MSPLFGRKVLQTSIWGPNKSVQPLTCIHSDLWGPSPCVSREGYRYYATFIDECTRHCWIFPLINKYDLFATFQSFYSYILNQFAVSVKVLQSDGGGEYISKAFQSFLATKGIEHHKSCPHTPQQNGLAERKHRHIVETSLTLLQTARLPPSFWFYACQTATYLINRMPSPILSHKSPFELLFGHVPLLSHLRVFGCACFPLLQPYNSTKLQPKTTKCVFLGYATKYKGYLCYEVSKPRMYMSRHVIFDETEFPYQTLSHHSKLHHSNSSHVQATSSLPVVGLNNTVSSYSSPLSPSPSVSDPNIIPIPQPDPSSLFPYGHSESPTPSLVSNTSITPISSPPSGPIVSHSSSTPVAHVPDSPHQVSTTVFQPDFLQVVMDIPPLNLHPMQTRSKSGIIKKKALSVVHSSVSTDPTMAEPSSYKQALKVPTWLQAMQEEINALHKQGTWTLVTMPPDKNLVGCKWVFKLKKNSDGSLARHKARLVAQGFSQEPGLDYGETFSPVVKPTTVCLVLALAAHYDWNLRQLDVKNAFLHGTLQEEVYMAQPPGFEDPSQPHMVCKLSKSLYGLKQAPRAWNERFTTALSQLGFQSTFSDSSLFVKTTQSAIVVLLLFVDDIIITGSDSVAVQHAIDSLTAEFDLKDLGMLHYFLGIQISKTVSGLFLSQARYIKDLLEKTEMLESKPCDTPCLPSSRLLKDDGLVYGNPSHYRSIVGALQYLTFTRPDIAFSVHQVCQFMQQPMVSHFTAVKRILRYLKGTQDRGLSYTKGDLTLKAFSDADWAGDPNDRRSTTGMVVFLGSNPISWSSKKQLTVSRSSTEAEYRALSSTSAELDWIKQLLHFCKCLSPVHQSYFVTTCPRLHCHLIPCSINGPSTSRLMCILSENVWLKGNLLCSLLVQMNSLPIFLQRG